MAAMTPTPDAVAAADEHPWRARRGPDRARPLRFFSLGREEALTRAHPIVPFLLAGPLIGGLLDQARFDGRLGGGALWAALGAGVLLWTFVEYAMHRWLFHWPVRPDAPRSLRLGMLLVHGHHHLVPDDPHRLVATPIQLGGLLLLVHGVLTVTVGPPWSGPLLAGFLLGYLAYEALHFRAHHVRPRTRIARALAGHHLRHHATDGDRRWGISTPLWDWILRTG